VYNKDDSDLSEPIFTIHTLEEIFMLDTHARHIVQPIIERTANLFTRKHLTANQVTWFAFLLGSSTGVLIIYHHSIWAVLVLWISGFLDAVDGTMARNQNTTSRWGTLLDITFDRIVELSVILGIAIVYPQTQFVLLILTASIVVSMTIFLTVGALSEQKGIKSFYYQAGVAERTEGFILLSLMVLIPNWLMGITIIFIIVELFTAMQRVVEAKKILSN
jgi:archaetidylinositol phosphate synthase